MSSIIHVKSKDGRRVYVYESTSYWDKEKKAPRSKRKLLGRLDENGNIVPTGRPGRPKKNPDPAPVVVPAADGTDYQKQCEELRQKCMDYQIQLDDCRKLCNDYRRQLDQKDKQIGILESDLRHAGEQMEKMRADILKTLRKYS